MKNYFYIFFIFIQIFQSIYTRIITIPFTRIISSDITEFNFYSNYANNIIYSTIKIGSQSKEIKAQIKMSQYSLCVRNDSSFDYRQSLTYKKNEDEFTVYNIDYYKTISSNETFIIGKENKQINNIKFMLTTNSKYDLDGILGLQIIENNYKVYGHNLISQIKLSGLIEKEVFFFNFDKTKEQGELIIGEYPHDLEEFKDKYSKEQSDSTSIHIPSFDIYYDIIFRSVFWNEKEIESMIVGNMNIEVGYIIGSKLFEDACYSFFEPFILKNICNKKEANIKNTIYNTYICDENPDLDISTFPEIKFYNSDTDHNLTLTYEDIFIKKNGKIYFMIVFDKRGYNERWTLGNIFLKSNMLAFDIDKRVITFYNQNKSKDKNPSNNIIYIIIICIAGIVILYLIGFIIYKFVFKPKAKRGIELKEDFEYTTEIND